MEQTFIRMREQILHATHRHIPLIIKGGGTKDFYGEQARPENADVLDTRAHSGIVAYDPAELVLTARAGTPLAELEALLAPLLAGHDVGLLSEAGCPAVADPGANLVRLAHRYGITVEPLVGPSSILLALMGSGSQGQRFAFNGYLPVPEAERIAAIRRLEKRSRDEDSAELFIETPYRNPQLLDTLRATLAPSTWLTVACDLTLPTQSIISRPVVDWRGDSADYKKRPAIFVLHASRR